MDLNTVYNELKTSIPGSSVLKNADMSAYTTFRAGGSADILVLPNSSDDLIAALKILNNSGINVYFLGCGSNVLIAPGGVRGAIIKLDNCFNELHIDGNKITAGASVRLSSIAHFALANGLTGLEFAAGIPGSVGGGVYMNAGAYGGELKDCTTEVSVLKNDFTYKTYLKDELEFGYRYSVFKNTGEIITKAVFELSPGDPEEIKAAMNDLALRRREKQPLEYPSAGSTFKRPPGYFAGTLIEQCGLKGFSCGGAQVSEKHAGFVINKGGATAQDILNVIHHVQNTVLKEKGILLETEVQIIGEL